MALNIIDSSVFVALFLDFDSNHLKAVSVIKNLKGKMLLSSHVVEEVVTVITYKHSKSYANQFIVYITQNKDINIIEGHIDNELKFFSSHNHKISFTDSVLVYLTKKNKAKLITFDKELEKIYKNI